MKVALITAAVAVVPLVSARNALARTPPMGWMSWEIFRCNLYTPSDDCTDKSSTMCVSQALYQGQADAMVDNGFAAAGYASIHMDDCWEEKSPPRDPVTLQLRADAKRFPDGMAALGAYVHAKNLSFATYTAESPETCGGYPASANHETLDAETFAAWGVDYLKVDGCGDASYYEHGYAAMGAALEATGRPIVYSCSWPAYINNGNESLQPFNTFINDGCNLWRNWDDIQCHWSSLSSIIDHFGSYSTVLAPYAGPGHWHDADMLLIGNGCITEDEERTQMAIWSIIASPLIMGNDMRNVSDASKAILLNPDAIAVSQDVLGQMGTRLSNSSSDATQVWARELADGSVAVALYNKRGGASPAPCPTWNTTAGGYLDSLPVGSGGADCFTGMTPQQAQAQCCADPACAGFSIDAAGAGCNKPNTAAGFVPNAGYTGYFKPQGPSPGGLSADITVQFADLDLVGTVQVYDIWARKSLGCFKGSFTAQQVAYHGTGFYRLTQGGACKSA